MRHTLKLALLSASALVVGAANASAGYTTANTPDGPNANGFIQLAQDTTAEKPAMEEKTEQPVMVPATSLDAGSLATEAPMVKPAEAMEKPMEEQPMEEKTAEEKPMEAMETGKKHMIARGDNYWNLAKKYYGDATMWSKISEANPDMPSNDLAVGAEIVIPE